MAPSHPGEGNILILNLRELLGGRWGNVPKSECAVGGKTFKIFTLNPRICFKPIISEPFVPPARSNRESPAFVCRDSDLKNERKKVYPMCALMPFCLSGFSLFLFSVFYMANSSEL